MEIALYAVMKFQVLVIDVKKSGNQHIALLIHDKYRRFNAFPDSSMINVDEINSNLPLFTDVTRARVI